MPRLGRQKEARSVNPRSLTTSAQPCQILVAGTELFSLSMGFLGPPKPTLPAPGRGKDQERCLLSWSRQGLAWAHPAPTTPNTSAAACGPHGLPRTPPGGSNRANSSCTLLMTGPSLALAVPSLSPRITSRMNFPLGSLCGGLRLGVPRGTRASLSDSKAQHASS